MREGELRRLVQRVLQDLRGPEREHAPGGDLDLLSGLRVAADARLLLAHDEVAEPGKLDLFAALQRVLQRVEDHLDDLRGFLLGEPDLAAHAVDDVSLCHGKNDTRTAPTRSNPEGIGAVQPVRDASRRTPQERRSGALAALLASHAMLEFWFDLASTYSYVAGMR